MDARIKQSREPACPLYTFDTSTAFHFGAAWRRNEGNDSPQKRVTNVSSPSSLMISKVTCQNLLQFHCAHGQEPSGSSESNPRAGMQSSSPPALLRDLARSPNPFRHACGFRKQDDHLAVESWNVVGLSAGDEMSIAHDFAVHPVSARIFEIGFQRGP
jgi:hypothetical protein